MRTRRRWGEGIVIGVVAFALKTVTVAAQQPTATHDTIAARDSIELTRAEIQKRRQEIVQQLMALSSQESERFWPVYREYRNAVAHVNDEKLALASKYLSSYDSLSAEQAEDLLKGWFKVRQKHLDVQKDYVDDFRKVLSPQKVTRFYQIENVLDAIVSANLQANLPMVP